MAEITKNPVGRPRVDAVALTVRLPPRVLATLDMWIDRQADPKPSRPEAIRRLIVAALMRD